MARGRSHEDYNGAPATACLAVLGINTSLTTVDLGLGNLEPHLERV